MAALPSSGNLSLNDILIHLGKSSGSNYSLKDCADGTVATLNTRNDLTNIQATPYRISDWYGYDHALTGASKPTIHTDNATNITTTTADCGGNTISDGGATITAKGLVWTDFNNGQPSLTNYDGIYTHGTGGTASFNGTYITGLTAGNIYYVKAYATNSQGTSYGELEVFQAATSATLPTIVTNPATNILTTSANLNCELVSAGSSAVTSFGWYIYTSNPPYPSGTQEVWGSPPYSPAVPTGTGLYTKYVGSLTQGQPYYFQAYATNSSGTVFGDVMVFTPGDAD